MIKLMIKPINPLKSACGDDFPRPLLIAWTGLTLIHGLSYVAKQHEDNNADYYCDSVGKWVSRPK
jgi:hypothetical protein